MTIHSSHKTPRLPHHLVLLSPEDGWRLTGAEMLLKVATDGYWWLHYSVVRSHWSRSNEARLSLVESFIVLLRQCLLCHKEPAPRIQSPLLGAFCLLLAGSLWHKDSWLPCTERSYYRRPYAIKNQRGASKKPLVGGFGCDELVLYGIRELAPATLSTNERQASTFLDQ